MKRTTYYLCSLAVACLFALVACADKENDNYSPPTWSKTFFPLSEWSVASPIKYGYKADTRDTLDAFLNVSAHAVTGLVVIVGGEMIYSWGAIDKTDISPSGTGGYLASARKSILSMIYGKYVDNGTIDLTKTIGELIDTGMIPDDVGGLLPIEKKATVFDCITARSGVYHLASNTGDDRAIAPPRGSQEPGTYFLYNNWDFNVSGNIFEAFTGKNIYDALGTDIAVPIGMEDWDRSRQSKGGTAAISVYQAYHFYLSARDIARLGYLMLRGGNWNGTQVIPADWCAQSTAAYTPVSEMIPISARTQSWGYGYMWWVWDGPANRDAFKGAYSAKGAGGQYITVLPALDMVVAQKRNADFLGGTSSSSSIYNTYSENSYLQFLRLIAAQQEKPNYLN
ncbi:amide hydrolase [Bacteroidia bacterium]|nr:amide hydrolase [Bacteroidia bacterium]